AKASGGKGGGGGAGCKVMVDNAGSLLPDQRGRETRWPASERGYATGYRTGRSIGMAHLESPELKHGDKTVLKAGMTFAVDGGISVDGELGGRIGDSIVVTETGCEYLTEYPRQLLVVDR
ncbi:MAG: M24 family metallopeptidase, partial [Pseudomonadota bacterium]